MNSSDLPFDSTVYPAATPPGGASHTPVDRLNRLILLCHAANAARRHFELTVLREVRLTWTSYDILQLVIARQPIHTRTIAAICGLAKSTVTVVSRELATRGLLWRRVDGDGKYQHIYLHPTPAAWPLVEDVRARLITALTAFADATPADETAAVLRRLITTGAFTG